MSNRLDVQIKLGDEEMKEVIAEALLKELGTEQRDQIIATAIRELITIRNEYGSKISPLQKAFNNAVEYMAETIAREQISQNAEIKQQIEALLAAAAAKLFGEEEREKLVETLAGSIRRAITGDRY